MLTRIIRAMRYGGRALPDYVQRVLDEAVFITRESDAEDGPRVFVCLAGGSLRGSFAFSRERAKERFTRRWPELSPSQISRAVDVAEAGAMRAARADRPEEKRRGWIWNY